MATITRSDRSADVCRPITLEPHVSRHAEGSCLAKFGNTHVLCTASIEPDPPRWLAGKGTGWVTAEYAMLPRSTHSRIRRDQNKKGRALEISRLIGRTLRAITDLAAIGERAITVDCDVIQADGGTRTAAITGGFVALAFALRTLYRTPELFSKPDTASLATPFAPLRGYLGAVSAGLVDDQLLLDLAYEEDSAAAVDMNLVATDAGEIVEVQMTAEDTPLPQETFQQLLALNLKGIEQVVAAQKDLLGPLDGFFTLEA